MVYVNEIHKNDGFPAREYNDMAPGQIASSGGMNVSEVFNSLSNFL